MKKTRVTASILGIFAGIGGGVFHGIGEVLQGSLAPEGIYIYIYRHTLPCKQRQENRQ